MRRSAVVIGGGLGGLATALRLQHAGWQVTLLEKNAQLGGRCNVIRADGFSFDTGPTLLLMRDVLDDLFASLGRNLDTYLDLVRLRPNYRVHFADGWSLEFSPRLDAMESALEEVEPGAGLAFRRYLADAGYKYRIARARFVEKNFPHWYSFVTAPNLYYLLATNTLRKLDRHAARYFRDPRLIAAFTFQTMYLGLSPAAAPAVYSLLPYTELQEGIWFPRGGMYRVVEALERLAREMGMRIETGAEVGGLTLRGSRAIGVELDGAVVPADVVVCNADLPYAYQRLIPRAALGALNTRRLARLDYGSSAYLLYLGVRRSYPQLNHHNVFLAGDMDGNFDAIFRRRELPENPSLYICVAGRTDASLAPPGHEGLYVLVPVPRLSERVSWEAEAERFRDRVYERLEDVGLHDLRRSVVYEQAFTPRDFADEYNILYGSAFGLAHGFSQVGYMRPANKARRLDNVYFVGASTVPGGGMPMVILGSRLVAQRVQQEQKGG